MIIFMEYMFQNFKNMIKILEIMKIFLEEKIILLENYIRLWNLII